MSGAAPVYQHALHDPQTISNEERREGTRAAHHVEGQQAGRLHPDEQTPQWPLVELNCTGRASVVPPSLTLSYIPAVFSRRPSSHPPSGKRDQRTAR